MDTISVAAATILTGLSAGLLYGWRVSVIPGTSRTSSHAYVETMQSINRAILNPAFFLVFLGAPMAIAVATVVSFVEDANARAGLLAFAFVLYLTTTVVTTAVGNIPLNGHLEAFDARRATGAEVDAARGGYERPWNRWHDVRTVSSASAFVLCVLAAFVDVS
jgi:uncharacterized membrane protein